jgi:hypothetical protein
MGAQYSDGKVPEQPSEIELFNWFIQSNATDFGSTQNITSNDVEFSSYVGNNRTLTVKSGNEYWTGSKTITYALEDAAVSLDVAVPLESRALTFLKIPNFADFMRALDANLTTTIVWSAIKLPDGCSWATVTEWDDWSTAGQYVLTPLSGNLYYTGTVTITWSIT